MKIDDSDDDKVNNNAKSNENSKCKNFPDNCIALKHVEKVCLPKESDVEVSNTAIIIHLRRRTPV